MRSLVNQRTGLGYTRFILGTTLLVLTLRGGDFRMGVSIIRLYSEVADVLDHIDFEAHVLGITQVIRHVIGIGSGSNLAIRCYEHLFYRVFQILIEYAGKNLFGLAWEPLPAQVDVVDAGTLQVWITLFLILLALNLIRHYLVEARTVDGAIVRETHVHLLGWRPLDGCRWQIIPVALLAHLSHVAEVLEHGVNLVGVLGTETGIQFAHLALQGYHGVGSADVLLGIVVELRSLRIRSLASPIDVSKLVYSVAIQSLRDVGRIEDVRIISVAAFLSAILCARLPESLHRVGEMGIVREVDVTRPVGILVVLESAFGTLRQGLGDVLVAFPDGTRNGIAAILGFSAHGIRQGNVSSIRIFLLSLREHARPIYGKILGKMMRTLQVGGEDALGG